VTALAALVTAALLPGFTHAGSRPGGREVLKGTFPGTERSGTSTAGLRDGSVIQSSTCCGLPGCRRSTSTHEPCRIRGRRDRVRRHPLHRHPSSRADRHIQRRVGREVGTRRHRVVPWIDVCRPGNGGRPRDCRAVGEADSVRSTSGWGTRALRHDRVVERNRCTTGIAHADAADLG
jgi:hypothetical protein